MIKFTWLIYPKNEVSSQVLFERAMDALESASLIEDAYTIDGKKWSLPAVSCEFDDDSRTSFKIEGIKARLSLRPIGGYNLDIFSISVPSNTEDQLVDAIAECVLNVDGVHCCVLVDEGYYQRQNQRDPSLIDNLKGLTLISNGESGEYERKVVDTSINPGRFVLRKGYFETIGGIMWLKAGFFMRTGATRDRLDMIKNLEIQESENAVKLILDQNFLANGSEDESLIRLQNEVRAALFPESTQNV